jgi:transposase-like protein
VIHPQVELLTSREVARRIGVNPATLRKWVLRGRFPRRPGGDPAVAYTPGGQLRIHADAVDLHWPEAK